MSKDLECYLSHLWEIGRQEMKDLEIEDYIQLTSRLIKETPTKMLPLLENYDKTRYLIIMLSAWMNDEDPDLAQLILEEMRDIAITAMTPMIEDVMESYRKRNAIALREEQKNLTAEGMYYDRNRI